jgi:hypothetical protein
MRTPFFLYVPETLSIAVHRMSSTATNRNGLTGMTLHPGNSEALSTPRWATPPSHVISTSDLVQPSPYIYFKVRGLQISMLQRFLTRRLTRNFQQFQSQIHRSMSLSAMSARLTGKTVLITGASSGIGRATAFEFSRTAPDIKLILTARRIDTLREIAAELEKESNGKTKVLPVQFDVSKPAEVREFVGKLPEEWRDVDVLVNNA